MGINHRKLDNLGRPLKNPYETTVEAQDRIARDIANGLAGASTPAAAEQCGTQQEASPACAGNAKVRGAKPPVCPRCRGYGHIITDIVNGDSEPCPMCNVARWDYEAHDDCVDACSINAQPDPSCAPHSQTGLRPWEIDPAVAPTGIGDMVREVKGLGNDVIIHTPAGGLNDAELKRMVEQAKKEIMAESEKMMKSVFGAAPLGRARNLTATEVLERKRMAEKEQQRFSEENASLKAWADYVKRSLEEEKGN